MLVPCCLTGVTTPQIISPTCDLSRLFLFARESKTVAKRFTGCTLFNDPVDFPTPIGVLTFCLKVV